jgi:hypothetical protein
MPNSAIGDQCCGAAGKAAVILGKNGQKNLSGCQPGNQVGHLYYLDYIMYFLSSINWYIWIFFGKNG